MRARARLGVRWETCIMDDAAPPPMPIRNAGPPSLTHSMPTSGVPFARCAGNIVPTPPENMIGLIHSRRSLFGRTIPNERVYPCTVPTPLHAARHGRLVCCAAIDRSPMAHVRKRVLRPMHASWPTRSGVHGGSTRLALRF